MSEQVIGKVAAGNTHIPSAASMPQNYWEDLPDDLEKTDFTPMNSGSGLSEDNAVKVYVSLNAELSKAVYASKESMDADTRNKLFMLLTDRFIEVEKKRANVPRRTMLPFKKYLVGSPFWNYLSAAVAFVAMIPCAIEGWDLLACYMLAVAGLNLAVGYYYDVTPRHTP